MKKRGKFFGIIVIAVILIAIAAGICVRVLLYNGEETVDTEYINGLLEKSSELTTAKFHYTGMIEYNDTGLPIINKSDFTMVYKAVARAGIDVKKADVKSDEAKK